MLSPDWRNAPPEPPATTWNNEALPTASFRGTKNSLRKSEWVCVHLGDLKTSMRIDGLRQEAPRRSRALRVCHLVVRSGFKLTGPSRLACTMYNQKMFIFWFMWVLRGGGQPLSQPPERGGSQRFQCADRASSVRIARPVCRFRTPHAQSRARSPGALPFTLGQRKMMGNQPLRHRDFRASRTELGPYAAGHTSCPSPILSTID